MAGTKLALFGATGNTGRAVLKLALERGYEVRALVRTPSKVGITHANLTVFEGGYDAADKITETIAGCEYVVSVAGGPMGGGIKYPDNLMLNFVDNIIPAITNAGTVKCFLYQAGFLARTPAEKVGSGLPCGTWLLRKTLVPLVGIEPNLQDHEAVMQRLAEEQGASGLQTIVTLPSNIKKGPAARTLAAGSARSFKLNMAGVTFEELAILTLDSLANEALYGKHVFMAMA